MGRERFTKAERLLSRREFILANRYGKRFSTQGVLLLVKENRTNKQAGPRLGITTSRKVGKAHDRNRLKRWCREFFRRNKSRFQAGRDYVVIIKPNHGIESLADLEERLSALLPADKQP